ncbi:hypothetical protein [Sansalvadorimonas verongulae]|uniref:hypothetical protein n=1 Tax=Sansalvadorimonas verongulae TaxID=2172824 RepID=UPI0012BC1991|nr:hypothetical protein [Sansalvadorimonas verongulae]MTI14995.1 hypothetical protein [Sansalvadorimonas verongulae]
MNIFLRACLWLALGIAFRSYGYDNFCVEKRWEASRPSAYCQGLVIPAHKTRNFISEQLQCDSGSSAYTRGPIPFDEEEWRDLHNTDPAAAKEMLRSLPAPQWSGTVKYSAYLHWSWEDCQLVTSFACGSDKVCRTTTNKDGESEESCRKEPRTCYLDVTVSEVEHCSHEALTYSVDYHRIDAGNNEYLARLANGFDLLPGEEEEVTVDNGVGYFHSARLLPKLSVGEPRNNYVTTNSATDGFVCRQHSNYHVDFVLTSNGRVQSRSGNAFSLPESFDGERLPPLEWQDKAYPAVFRVQDYSSASLNEFARDSNDIFKNIRVRIQLYDKSGFGWPVARNTIYVEQDGATRQTLNALSENQSVRRSQLWELMLATNSVDPRKNLYRNYIPWFVYYPARLLLPAEQLSYENMPSPGTDYELRLTVYQRGLAIYHQACEDDPKAWDCRFYAGGGWFSPSRYESGHYSSKSLNVGFTTPDNVNVRSYWPMFWNTVNAMGTSAFIGAAAYGALRIAARLAR